MPKACRNTLVSILGQPNWRANSVSGTERFVATRDLLETTGS
jgi:hypothetical protein